MNWARNGIFIFALCCYSAATQAQTGNLPEFFDRYFRVEAVKGQNGPKVTTQFDYQIQNTFIANSHVKLNREGVEDYMAVGLVQDFGVVGAKIIYNMHRFAYPDRVDENDTISLDLSYRALRLQHHINSATKVSQLNLPFDLFAATLDLSYSQTVDSEVDDTVDIYQVSSQSKRMRIAAAWKSSGDTTATEFTTEYKPYDSWLMKVSYTDDGAALQRQFRSEYATYNYRIAGEYQFRTNEDDKDSVTGAISIEKDTNIAALKLRLEYNNTAATSAVYFEVASKKFF